MNPIRLMVVDDHEMLREGLRFMLRNEPDLAIVCEAEDGAQAIGLIEEARPDVVLLDVRMPNVDGLEALRRIRDRWPDLPVVILTVYDDPEYVEEALACGASGYLLKSVPQEELVRAVRAVSDGAGYLQAEVTRPVLERFARGDHTKIAAELSRRETDVLTRLAAGMSNKQIARELGISESTVKGYVRDVFEKLGAADRAHAVALALRSRLID